jgi:hypothetical protein
MGVAVGSSVGVAVGVTVGVAVAVALAVAVGVGVEVGSADASTLQSVTGPKVRTDSAPATAATITAKPTAPRKSHVRFNTAAHGTLHSVPKLTRLPDKVLR